MLNFYIVESTTVDTFPGVCLVCVFFYPIPPSCVSLWGGVGVYTIIDFFFYDERWFITDLARLKIFDVGCVSQSGRVVRHVLYKVIPRKDKNKENKTYF